MEFSDAPESRRPASVRPRRSIGNLAYLGLVEILFGYRWTACLTTGCDKTTPACLMARRLSILPAIVLSGGPMLNGWPKARRSGSGTVVWKAREHWPGAESTTRSS